MIVSSAPILVIRMWRLFGQIEAIAAVRYSRRDRPPVDASGACRWDVSTHHPLDRPRYGFRYARNSRKTERSFLRQPGLAETGKIRGFDQGAHFRNPPRFDGPQASDAGVTIVADQPARFGELGCGAFELAFESMGTS